MYDTFYNDENAPSKGAIICPSDSVKEGQAHFIDINHKDKVLPVILTRINNIVYCYTNMCPHQYLPLNYRSDNIISSDGQHFLCSVHGAVFGIKSGNCSKGNFDKLDAIPVNEDQNGYVLLNQENSSTKAFF